MALKSKFEKAVQEFLKVLKISFWYEPLKLPYVVTKNYIPDFVIYKGSVKKPKKPLTSLDLNDNFIIVEAKGFFDYDDRVKMLAVKEKYPDLDIRMLFQSNSYIYKNKKGAPRRTKESTDLRYGDWCDKNGFPWAIGEEIPNEWLQ